MNNFLKRVRKLLWVAIFFGLATLIPALILNIKETDIHLDQNYIHAGIYCQLVAIVLIFIGITYIIFSRLNIYINKSEVAAHLNNLYQLNDSENKKYEPSRLELIPDKTTDSLTDSRITLADLLTDLISCCGENHVYGLNSPWGRGKTSIMKRTEKNLHFLNSKGNQQKKVVTAWLPAWTIDSKVHPAIALIETITDAMEKQIPMDHPIHEVSRFLRDWTNKSGLKEVSLGKMMILDWKKVNQSGHCDFQRIARELRMLSAKSNQYKIVIFIDDIDRCEGSIALELLDSLKSIFYQQLFVFVAAYDRSIIERSLELKYLAENNNEKNISVGIYKTPIIRAQAYLNKIIQTEIDVPCLHDSFDSFLDELLKTYVSGIRSREDPSIGARLEIAQVIEIIRKDKQLVEFIKYVYGSNPRNTITLINKVLLDSRLHKEDFYLKRYEELFDTDEVLDEGAKKDLDKVFLSDLLSFQKFCLVHYVAMHHSEHSIENHYNRKDDIKDVPTALTFMKTLSKQISNSSIRESDFLKKYWIDYPKIFRLMQDIYDDRSEIGKEEKPEETSKKIVLTALEGQLGVAEARSIENLTTQDAEGRHLDLADTQFSHISEIVGAAETSSIRSLSGLCLTRTLIQSLDGLENFKSLTHLRVRGCTVADLNPIKHLPLVLLDISNISNPDQNAKIHWPKVEMVGQNGFVDNKKDWKPANLRYLFIENCPFDNISFVLDNRSIKELWISENDVNKWLPPHNERIANQTTEEPDLKITVITQGDNDRAETRFKCGSRIIILKYYSR